MQTEMTTKNEAILTAVEELTLYADPQVYQKTMNEVLIEFLGNTDLDSMNRGRIVAIFAGLTDFLNDIELVEA